ncbi:MAG: lysophospholipid acyltransferase family protein [Parvularculaceae bacterium]
MLNQIRSAVFTLILVLLVLVLGVVCLPVILFGRKAAREVVRFWAKLTLGALHLVAGVSSRVEGTEHFPLGGAIIACNHQSMWETVKLYAMCRKPVMILKKELLSIPVYGWWARAAGNIPIDRKGGARALRAMMREAKSRIDQGEQIVIFPEGTRRPVGSRDDFQPGVAGVYAMVSAPCTPIAHDSGKHWLHPGIMKIPGVITMRVLPPIPAGLPSKDFLARVKHDIDRARPDLEEAANG